VRFSAILISICFVIGLVPLVCDVTECYHRCNDDSEGEDARNDDCKVYDFLLRCLRLHTKILSQALENVNRVFAYSTKIV